MIFPGEVTFSESGFESSSPPTPISDVFELECECVLPPPYPHRKCELAPRSGQLLRHRPPAAALGWVQVHIFRGMGGWASWGIGAGSGSPSPFPYKNQHFTAWPAPGWVGQSGQLCSPFLVRDPLQERQKKKPFEGHSRKGK